jgi:tetratricopeptide (TPR) repeat protein
VERPAPILWIASILCFALALAAKETAAMFPLLLLVWDACARERGHAPPRAWRLRCHAPYWAVLAMAIVVVALAVPRYRELAAVSLALRSPLENLFAQAKPLVLALVLFVRPALLNIDHDLAPASVHDATAWAAPAGLVGLLVVALKARRIPALGLGVLWFFVAALPANGPVARLDLLSERNLYLPMAGLALAAAGSFGAVAVPLMDRLGAAGGALAALVALITIGALAMATVERNAVWADPVALWSDAVAKSPRKSRPHDNLGYALERQGDLAGAIREYRRALDLDPNNARAWSNLRRAWRAAEPD